MMALITCPECEAGVSSAAPACIRCGYPLSSPDASVDVGDLVLRIISGLAGAGLAYAAFVGAYRVDPGGPPFMLASASGACGAIAIFWYARGRHGHPLRWYHVLGLAVVGSVIAHVILGTASTAGDPRALAFALGYSVGVGAPDGLVLGAAAALLLYGIRGPTARSHRPAYIRGGRPPSPPRGRVATHVSTRDDAGSPRESSSTPRIYSGLAGGVLGLAVFVEAAWKDSGGPMVVATSALGACCATAIYWLFRARRGHPLRWYQVIGLAVVGSVVAQAILAGVLEAGSPWQFFVVVASPILGVPYGLVLGVVGALLLYGIRGPAPRRAGEGAVDD